MSKLESFIRRMTAQRDCLNHAARLMAGTPGPVFELGLGNGRTYDHLRELFPDRDIFVFDLRMNAFESCTPPEEKFIAGDVLDTLAAAEEKFGNKVAMVHNDLGSSQQETTLEIAAAAARLLAPLVTSGGVVVSNNELSVDNWVQIPGPPGVKQNRYYMYRAS